MDVNLSIFTTIMKPPVNTEEKQINLILSQLSSLPFFLLNVHSRVNIQEPIQIFFLLSLRLLYIICTFARF